MYNTLLDSSSWPLVEGAAGSLGMAAAEDRYHLPLTVMTSIRKVLLSRPPTSDKKDYTRCEGTVVARIANPDLEQSSSKLHKGYSAGTEAPASVSAPNYGSWQATNLGQHVGPGTKKGCGRNSRPVDVQTAITAGCTTVVLWS